MSRLVRSVLAVLVFASGTHFAHAEEEAGAELPSCVQTASPDVFAEGRPMLRLSDVAACDPTTYEVIPSFFINGEPAVRLLPQAGETGAASVLIEGKPASRLGDDG